MKLFKDLTKKELKVWEGYIQNQLSLEKRIPMNLLQSYWEDRYREQHHIWHSTFNTKPSKTPKVLEPVEEHRTYTEDYKNKYYEECI